MGAQRLLFYIKQNTLWGLSTVSEEFSVLTAMDKKLTIQSIFYPPAIHFYLHPMYVLSLDEARPASDSMWILNRRSGRQSPGQWLWKNYTVGPVCKETPHNSPLLTGVLVKRWIRILLLLSGWLHWTMCIRCTYSSIIQPGRYHRGRQYCCSRANNIKWRPFTLRFSTMPTAKVQCTTTILYYITSDNADQSLAPWINGWRCGKLKCTRRHKSNHLYPK